MLGTYDYRVATLGIIVAILASYTALDLVGRVRAARSRDAYAWLAAGAVAMGTGIWSMHFVAMLAFELPIAMGYDFGITALSWLMAVGASTIALLISSRSGLSMARLLVGAVFMAAGIAGMHYTGMYAMLMEPGIDYDPLWVAISLAVALIVSGTALWVAFYLREVQRMRGFAGKAGAAVLMGGAIAGMHYAGMAAARFPVGGICGAANQLDTVWLATLVGACTILLLGIALTAAALDRRLENQTAKLVKSLSEANRNLSHASRHDPLTNLANRNLLHERIGSALQQWQDNQEKFAVIYVDLDGFKVINDQLGHDIGDGLLKRAASAMMATVRHKDTVARIGGDEFVLVLHDVPDQRAIERVCNKLLDSIFNVQAGSTRLTASIGSAVCPDDGDELSQLVTAADVAMYIAKNKGKNCYQQYSANMASRISEDFQMQEELGEAIKIGHLVVHYQPKYSTRERRLTGAEALVRWQHPEKGLIAPDRFIGIAERSGLIHGLEAQVLDSVCAQIRQWLDAGLVVPPISVNLSAVRIHDEDLPTRTKACLDRHGLDASYLMFEITESLAVREILRAIEALKRLSAMGVNVALDDFGTGYSSLSYLRQLPIQQLKIDRSFIIDLAAKEGDHVAIVRSIIGLAHALRLHVVAEGVETEEQMAFLDKLGCDEVQGFLMSKPVEPEAFAAIIEADRAREGKAKIHRLPVA
ncbi:putative bifunctional diguanylate cyclase/phosphodiesterase [Salinisphaera aquimarina]|uniref:Bifunctional diguanylate cyclase/phosphodiesterase n=1 Tax=Salinisphaera aquimarina TaxID=2094031 RepID=A0ABV7ENS1_9GAMM